jgi:hypothetical protein
MAGVRAQATHDGPRATLSREVGAGAVGTRGGSGAAPSWEAGARAVGICDGPGAAPSQEAGTGAFGHVSTRARLVICHDLQLVCEVPGTQGTDSVGFSSSFLFSFSLSFSCLIILWLPLGGAVKVCCFIAMSCTAAINLGCWREFFVVG